MTIGVKPATKKGKPAWAVEVNGTVQLVVPDNNTACLICQLVTDAFQQGRERGAKEVTFAPREKPVKLLPPIEEKKSKKVKVKKK